MHHFQQVVDLSLSLSSFINPFTAVILCKIQIKRKKREYTTLKGHDRGFYPLLPPALLPVAAALKGSMMSQKNFECVLFCVFLL